MKAPARKLGAPALALVCLLAVILSATGVVYAKYSSRKYFVELQGLRSERDAIDVEWSRLQLELSTLATHWRIEEKASKELQMQAPLPQQVIVIAPES